jgi:hypothetical protein
MRLVSAFKVEEDLHGAWAEQREQELQSDVKRNPERRGVMPVGLKG